ncbi:MULTISPECIES: 3-oxoacyl-ACP reductase family protein [unclassified Streptomyces]|uniref:3-oxoacyl-ACP reductase family protein n=1 Tax=unclassified Streptomyces TaxID=2593676 RepID=UPI0004C89B65|nr:MULTISPECIES: 3-oxoacyl-ACP reductase family protein [unclassified Streptomyces]KOX00905.1 oxidoreductase [Streptomyces sp. NRRL WC-3723]
MTDVLSGKKALVTGGSRGIGAGVVRRLAADGASVAFTYVQAKDTADALVGEIVEAGGRAVAIQADAADRASVRSAVATTVAELGGLDILVNNAGQGVVAPLAEFPDETFDRIMALNVTAAFTAIQAASEHLTEGGRVITIGSVNADIVPFAGLSAYTTSKAAVAGLTRAVAVELAPRGITVNNLQVGPTNTESNPDSGPFAKVMTGLMPIGKFAQPSDIASAVAYLAGPEAWYVTGASWNVDGGFGLGFHS